MSNKESRRVTISDSPSSQLTSKIHKKYLALMIELTIALFANRFTPSELSGVKQLLPAENALILNNGRRIGYKQLVLATGIKHDFTQIKGFYEALEDPEHPVYASKGKKI